MEVQQLSQVKDDVITPPFFMVAEWSMLSRQGTKWGGAAPATAAPVTGATKTLLPS